MKAPASFAHIGLRLQPSRQLRIVAKLTGRTGPTENGHATASLL